MQYPRVLHCNKILYFAASNSWQFLIIEVSQESLKILRKRNAISMGQDLVGGGRFVRGGDCQGPQRRPRTPPGPRTGPQVQLFYGHFLQFSLPFSNCLTLSHCFLMLYHIFSYFLNLSLIFSYFLIRSWDFLEPSRGLDTSGTLWTLFARTPGPRGTPGNSTKRYVKVNFSEFQVFQQ